MTEFFLNDYCIITIVAMVGYIVGSLTAKILYFHDQEIENISIPQEEQTKVFLSSGVIIFKGDKFDEMDDLRRSKGSAEYLKGHQLVRIEGESIQAIEKNVF